MRRQGAGVYESFPYGRARSAGAILRRLRQKILIPLPSAATSEILSHGREEIRLRVLRPQVQVAVRFNEAHD